MYGECSSVNEILEGFLEAIRLIVTLDPEVLEIASRSLLISLLAIAISAGIAIPLGSLIHLREFPGKGMLIGIIHTLYSLPTVIAGLFVFLLLSSAGPFGFLRLLFTPAGMVLGQAVLVLPVLTGLTLTALSGVGREKRDMLLSLGATELQSMLAILGEARYAILSAVILGFGRAISEVGAAMIIGGNIRGQTRVLTTAIALETSRGNFALSIALGLILLLLAVCVNLSLVLLERWRQ